jgi:HPt (histidine-containing phosphotransfer) domain-containing protein
MNENADDSMPVLDPSALRELGALGAELGEPVLEEVLKAFRASAPALVAALLSAASAGDRAGAARASHTLRSAAGQLGAVRLVERARRVEAEAKGAASSLEDAALACAEALREAEQALLRLEGTKP